MAKNDNTKPLKLFIGSFLLYEMLCYLANAMIMPSMLTVIKFLHANNSDISITVMLYIIGTSVIPIIVSPFADMIGKQRILIVGCSIFALANLICPFASTLFEFSFFRFLQGVGQGFVFLGYVLVHESFDDVNAVKLTSIMASITNFAPILGPVLGSIVGVSLGWKYVFWLTGSFAVLALMGLIKCQSELVKTASNITINTIKQDYMKILSDKRFILGVFVLTLALLPSELWIIFSIIIVRDSLHLSLFLYNAYMVILVASSIISFFMVGRLINKFSFMQLIVVGNIISIIGSIAATFCHFNPTIFIGFLAGAIFGGGLFRGIIFRKLITSVHENKNRVSAVFTLILSIILMSIVFFMNLLFKQQGYSLLYFGIVVSMASTVCAILIFFFLRALHPATSVEVQNAIA
jgi:DHA1 family multidrug/chloramphenicol efflux transport protein-like MFS transporter